MPIERGKIREYARATENTAPQYLDDQNPPITPTFLSSVVFWDDIGTVMNDPHVLDACARVGLTPTERNLLALEQEYVFCGALPRAGETLHTSVVLDRVENKTGAMGPMVLCHTVVSFHDESGQLRAECLYTSAYVTTEANQTHD